jgi:hypothetical protein
VKFHQHTAALAASVMALFAFSHDAKAVTIFSEDPSDFASLPSSSVSPFTPQTTGTVLFNEHGSDPNIYRSPFENAVAGDGVLDPLNGGYQLSGFDALPYTSVQANSTATYTFATAVTSLSLLWGSPDSYNYIEFFGAGGTPEGIISGDPLAIHTYGHDLVTLTLGGESFDSVVLSSVGSNAFEFANLQGMGQTPNGQLFDVPLATPIPAALPLFAGGLGIIGFLARNRKRRSASAFAAS